MGFRLTCSGSEALAAVAASVVSRLARDAGLQDDDAARLADSARGACDRARSDAARVEITATSDKTRLKVDVRPGAAAGQLEVEGRLIRRRGRA